MVNGFTKIIVSMLDQPPTRVGTLSIPNIDAIAKGGDGHPHITTSKRFADGPDFVQDANCAIGLNATNKMDSASGNSARRKKSDAVTSGLAEGGARYAVVGPGVTPPSG